MINVRQPNPEEFRTTLPTGNGAVATRVSESIYGGLRGGQVITQYTLANANGLVCTLMNYGACLTQFMVPDRDGKLGDVVLGYPRLEDYLEGRDYFGATIGRVANRISGAGFILNGKKYGLTANEGKNHLHGGIRGFDKVFWQAIPSENDSEATLTLRNESPDGDEGYPGKLSALVSYTLNDRNELVIEYQAVADQPTPVNFTNHTYFNLASRGTILDHLLRLNADHFTPLDSAHLPTGEILPVAGTVADFRFPATLASRLEKLGARNHGFNHNYALNGGGERLAFAAHLADPESGRTLELWTDQPGLQFYTGAYIDPVPAGKHGLIYGPYSGLCLEPQQFPDAVNQDGFPRVILNPGQTYRQKTVWKFSTDNA